MPKAEKDHTPYNQLEGPYTPPLRTKSGIVRGTDEFGPRIDIGCSDIDFNKRLGDALNSAEIRGKLTHLPHIGNTRGDLLLRCNLHPERLQRKDTEWIFDQTDNGGAVAVAALKNNIPVLGVINLEYVQRGNDTVLSHLISYVLRQGELILLEPYDTDKLTKIMSYGGETYWIGIGPNPNWREDIKAYFEKKWGTGPLILMAPMKGKTLAEYDLTKNDKGAGQCGYWAIHMLEKVSTLDVRTATPEEFFRAIEEGWSKIKGGRKTRRKTRRHTRRHRRRAAQLTGKRV